MASVFLSSIISKISRQVLGFPQRSAVSPSSSSDPRSSILKDLKELEKTLKWIQAVLHDAEEREIRDESVKLWLKDLKEVAYQADNVLDEYQYEELRAQMEGRASRKRKREVSIPDSMGDRIRQIREKFDEISKLRERLCLREEDGERRVVEAPYPAPTSHMVDESSIYGRERDKQEIIDLLFSKGAGNGISVIPIVGKGGLGKTTIAQLVYNDPKVKEYFHLKGWVCVSDDFDVPRLTKAIIESLTQSPCDLTQLSTLQETLKEKVKGKEVLLVLDDVWNEQQSRWESLRKPFVGAESVTIIMTCRNDSVAEIMQTVRPYHPSYLSPEQSWSLFRHYAFGGRNPEEQPRLAGIGKQIVEKCSGLPLALKSIGSLLRYTADEESWMDVIQNDIWEVDENNEILPALRVSYSRMPAHLKPCFVYCSMFPKDYGFGKDELVRLWLAQGYIPSEGGRTMEDIGYEYFNDLQRRAFFDSYWSDFKMHDMIHDLAKSIAGNECCAIVDKKLPSLPNEVRHLYVKDEEEFAKSPHSYNFSALRTLFIQHWFRFPTEIQEIIKYSLLLRTLQFCWERKDEIPDFLGHLKHLRYLHITSNNIKKLPESICLLYHLQILILDCQDLGELPDGLGDLTNLQHLSIMADRIICLPAGIGKLTNLQILRGCYKVQGGIGVLKDLVNLQGNLCISRLRNMVNVEDARDASLKLKHKLEQLLLHWNAVNCENDPHHEIDDALLHLEALSGENMDVPADEKREEAMLEYLQPHADLKKLLINGYGGSKFPQRFSFASLQELHIIDCEKVRSLPQLRCLSNVRYLHIEECQQLTSLQGMQNLTSLKTLIIQNCPKLQIMAEDQLSYMPKFVQIVDCPGLSNWCLIRNLKCIQVASGSKLTISNTWENIMHGFDDLTSIEHLYFGNHWNSFLQKDSTFVLEELTIWRCTDIPLLSYLPELTSLRSLVIKDCPGIESLPRHLLPSMLKSFIVDSCENLSYLLLAQENRDALEELQLVNCPKLKRVEVPGHLLSSENLRIEQCPRVQLSPNDGGALTLGTSSTYSDGEGGEGDPRLSCGCNLQDLVRVTGKPLLAELAAMMDCEIEDNDCNNDKIMGLWDQLTTLMKKSASDFSYWNPYPFPHPPWLSSPFGCALCKTDPGPSRPWQMPLAEPPLICPQQQDLAIAFPDSQPFKPTTRQSDATLTVIDLDHSAVSDEADEGDMGEVLQLLLPSDSISQSLVQITAEPSLADKELLAMMQDNDCNHDKNPLYDNFSFSSVVNHLTTRMESVGSRSSNLPCAASITDPGPSRPWQMPLAEPPLICPQQQDLAVAFPDSQLFNPPTRQSDATVTFIDHKHSAVSPIFDEATDCSFLQLLPSGCGSQSSLHNNAEPSDQVHALVNVTSELPDNELLLQKHFIAILSSVRRAKSSSRHSFHSSKLTIDSSGKNSRRPTEKMKLANLRQSSKLVKTAIADSYREHQKEPVVLSSQPEACSIVDQLDRKLNFAMEQVNHDTAFPSSITVPIRGPESRQEESSCRTAENRFRLALGACFEGEGSGWALPAFPPADVIRYKSGSKSRFLGKRKVASDSTKLPKSKVQRTTEPHEDSGLISKSLVPSSRQTTPLESYSLPHLILDSGSDYSRFPAMDALPQETEGFGLVPHEYDPNFLADLEDPGALPDIIDIG